MNRIAKLLSIVLLVSLSSCFDEEEFSDVPFIEFQDLTYIDLESPNIDSLVLKFTFEDGGADIGLNSIFNDLTTPYQIYDLIIDAEDSAISISQEDLELPLFKAPVFIEEQNGELAYFFFPEQKVPFSDVDNRPLYDCDFYEIIGADTFYIARNEFHNNFHIEFEKKIRGDTIPIDFNEVFNNPDCNLGEFDGRIPFFDPDGKSGSIEYAMQSQVFRLAFLDDSIRVKFYIYDRKLNRSNTAFSEFLPLSRITRTQ